MEPPTLSGHGVTLRPLLPDDAAALFGGLDAALWAGMTEPLPVSVEGLAEVFARRIASSDSMFFAAVDTKSGKLAA